MNESRSIRLSKCTITFKVYHLIIRYYYNILERLEHILTISSLFYSNHEISCYQFNNNYDYSNSIQTLVNASIQ